MVQVPQFLEASSLKPEIVEGVDIMVVRELCGDVYFGKPAGIFVNDEGHRVGQNNMIYSEPEIERIARVAMDVAAKRGGKCCSIDKANVLDVSQLWKEVVIRVHGESWADSVELSHMYVDNAAMQLVRWPKQFDTIVCGNIFGDILSDEASMLVGSLGMLPSASLPSEARRGEQRADLDDDVGQGRERHPARHRAHGRRARGAHGHRGVPDFALAEPRSRAVPGPAAVVRVDAAAPDRQGPGDRDEHDRRPGERADADVQVLLRVGP